MAKTNTNSTPSLNENEKNKDGVTTNGSEIVSENKEIKEETKKESEEEKEQKTEKKKEYKFSDTDDVVIISIKRAGKSITANSLNVITFDEKGKATCKGLEARYLLESNLGFELGK